MPLPAFDPLDDPEADRARMRYWVRLWILVAIGGVGLVCGGVVPLTMYLRAAAAEREAAVEQRKAELMMEQAMMEAEEREREEREREKRAWQAGAPAGAKWEYTRAEFEQLVVGKTAEEAEAAVGPPSYADPAERASRAAIYRRRTTNPVTGRPDLQAIVIFANGKAVAVDYR